MIGNPTFDLDLIRHLEIVDLRTHPDLQFTIVGAGATGSTLVELLANLGAKRIRVYDPDTVSVENIAPQLPYGRQHIGMLKVEALRSIILEKVGLEIEALPLAVDGTTPLEGVVFLLTDTMGSRQDIWEGAIKYAVNVPFMIETRMGARDGRIYAINPMNPTQVTGWESRWYPDEETEVVTACGGSISVGPTASFLSSLAVWQFIRWFNAQKRIERGEGAGDEPEHELIFSLQPPMFFCNNF